MTTLPQPVRDFIRQSIDSVETLEILLLLRRADSYWSADAADELLGLRPGVAQKRLDTLSQAGLVSRGQQSGAYRYAPADDALRAAVEELAAAYETRRLNVINAIYSSNLERLRSFSNAFRLKDTDA